MHVYVVCVYVIMCVYSMYVYSVCACIYNVYVCVYVFSMCAYVCSMCTCVCVVNGKIQKDTGLGLVPKDLVPKVCSRQVTSQMSWLLGKAAGSTTVFLSSYASLWLTLESGMWE